MFSFFTDPLLRGPTIGSMFMASAVAMIGVLAFVQKKSLLGETLSHATYPGVTAAIALSSFLKIDEWLHPLVLFFAFLSALAGLASIHVLQTRLKVREDSALTLILAAFFGLGITIASLLQFLYPKAFRLAGAYLYGQVATMGDRHILLYGLFFGLVLAVIVLFYKELQALSFDRLFIRSNSIASPLMDALVFLLLVLAIVLGIRTVGVVLISALLIAPAVAGRQYTDSLSRMFVTAGCMGALSGFAGNYLSYTLSSQLSAHHLPTGPMIVLMASFLALFSLFFAPRRGLAMRAGRIFLFRCSCFQENILKRVWRTPEVSTDLALLGESLGRSKIALWIHLRFLIWHGWMQKGYQLTESGKQKAAHIVRLHRLWETYLFHYQDLSADKVHKNAEEIEHILTPELEQELTKLLQDPHLDPHKQPIPSRAQ